MYTVLGYVRSQGEYQGHAYDNVKLHCQKLESSPDFQGVEVEILKVPTPVFQEQSISVGSRFTPMYDKYGRIVGLLLD